MRATSRAPSPPARSPPTPSAVPDRRFVRDLFAWLAPRYEQALLVYSLGQDLRWKHVMVDRLRLEDGAHALDLASGTGLVLDRLSHRLGDSSVLGLDVNRPMLRRSRDQNPGRRLIQATAEELPFRSNSFDVVTAAYLFKYVRLGRLAEEVRRVLRPGGRLAGYDFSRPRDQTLAGPLYAFYLRTVLPWLGRTRAPSDRGWSELLQFLSQIAENSGWEKRILPALASNGFYDIQLLPSMGGAITWVWATTAGRESRHLLSESDALGGPSESFQPSRETVGGR